MSTHLNKNKKIAQIKLQHDLRDLKLGKNYLPRKNKILRINLGKHRASSK